MLISKLDEPNTLLVDECVVNVFSLAHDKLTAGLDGTVKTVTREILKITRNKKTTKKFIIACSAAF